MVFAVRYHCSSCIITPNVRDWGNIFCLKNLCVFVHMKDLMAIDKNITRFTLTFILIADKRDRSWFRFWHKDSVCIHRRCVKVGMFHFIFWVMAWLWGSCIISFWLSRKWNALSTAGTELHIKHSIKWKDFPVNLVVNCQQKLIDQ